MWQIIPELMIVQQNHVHMLLQAGSSNYPPSGRNGEFCWVNFFSLVTNSSLKLKMNICILELAIMFSKDLLCLYYILVIAFWFFREKLIFLLYFIVLFCPGYVLDFIMYHIWYTNLFFFSKIEKAIITNQFNLPI